jgi:hypothetical protein
MMLQLRSFLLLSFFVASAVAAVATHFWRQRIEAEFDPKPLYKVIYAQFEACRASDFGKAYDQASSGGSPWFSMSPRSAQSTAGSLNRRRFNLARPPSTIIVRWLRFIFKVPVVK